MHAATPSSSSFMIPASVKRPVLKAKSGRWASEVMTAEQWQSAQFPDVDPQFDDAPMPGPSERLYPPPPPPMHPRRTLDVVQQHSMMRWYQTVEEWTREAGKLDRERLIVAPPPRPPPFVNRSATLVPLPEFALGPYTFDRWVDMCRRWWVHVARHHERLSLLIGGAQMDSPTSAGRPVPQVSAAVLDRFCVCDPPQGPALDPAMPARVVVGGGPPGAPAPAVAVKVNLGPRNRRRPGAPPLPDATLPQ